MVWTVGIDQLWPIILPAVDREESRGSDRGRSATSSCVLVTSIVPMLSTESPNVMGAKTSIVPLLLKVPPPGHVVQLGWGTRVAWLESRFLYRSKRMPCVHKAWTEEPRNMHSR